jgi:hypothetical protein
MLLWLRASFLELDREHQMPNGTVAVAYAIEAVKASGTIVRVDPTGFAEILRKSDSPLIVTAEGWLFGKTYEYLTSYRGFCFYARSKEPLQLPGRAEIVHAQRVWAPS